MEVNVLNIKGEDTGRKVTLNESIFGIEPNDHAIYLDVKQFMANQRQGTHKSKERSEISGSTRKIGRQKGGGPERGNQQGPGQAISEPAVPVVADGRADRCADRLADPARAGAGKRRSGDFLAALGYRDRQCPRRCRASGAAS